MASIMTNASAMTALQSLNATNKDLAQVQSRINTGLSVSSTKDDSASYAIAQSLRSDVGGFKAVSDNGIIGDPRGATAAMGESVVEALAQRIARWARER
mgnify:CR=1 FL=1